MDADKIDFKKVTQMLIGFIAFALFFFGVVLIAGILVDAPGTASALEAHFQGLIEGCTVTYKDSNHTLFGRWDCKKSIPITFDPIDDNTFKGLELIVEPYKLEGTGTVENKLYNCYIQTYGFESMEIGEQYFQENNFSTWQYIGIENRGIHVFWASPCIFIDEKFIELIERVT